MERPRGGAPKHDESGELIVGYSAGRLDPETEAAFERHLASCTACREAVAAQNLVWSALDEDLGITAAVSPDFDEKLFQRIAEDDRRGWWARILTWPRRAADSLVRDVG
jgi:anti-sigma factor RsiW